jgi:hypothetical protein
MKSRRAREIVLGLSCLAYAGLSTVVLAAGPQTTGSRPAAVKTFISPDQAVEALIDAADRFDVQLLEELFGAAGKDLVDTGERAQDQQRARDFVAQAREKKSVSVDRNKRRAVLLVGNGDWPFPIPIVKRGARWSFDVNAGRQEVLNRRIGANELDAIEISRGFVEAQHEYALQKRDGYAVNQYAQRIISTPGTQDGLAWQRPDGTWGGPVGEAIARAIALGYDDRTEPFHGYFFKVLKGQGPAAPLGEMDFVVKGVMIGGFALLAAPAEYAVTGVNTFIVSLDGVVYQKDFGERTLDEFAQTERFNPDKSWTPVPED